MDSEGISKGAAAKSNRLAPTATGITACVAQALPAGLSATQPAFCDSSVLLEEQQLLHRIAFNRQRDNPTQLPDDGLIFSAAFSKA